MRPSHPAVRPAPVAPAGMWLFLLPASMLVALLFAGYDGHRILQSALLALPGLLWLLWPLPQGWPRRLQAMFVLLWSLSFVADSTLRAFLDSAHGSAPDGSMVLSAFANTTNGEVREYVKHYGLLLLVHAGLFFACSGFLVWFLGRWSRQEWPLAALSSRLALTVLACCVVAYVSKPWRKQHPALFWTQWSLQVISLKSAWAEMEQERQHLVERAKQEGAVLVAKEPSTVVLIISDSVNRDNLCVYGYGRPTSTRLGELLSRDVHEPGGWNQIRNAWSVDASTVPALRNLFYFGEPGSPDRQHLLALAAAAGYKTWWIGNHDDLGVEQEHARHAHEMRLINRVPGRATRSLDGDVMDEFCEAMGDSAPNKFVVVHLLGAHPHYRLRHPEGEALFSGVEDGVMEQLESAGRSEWVQRLRNDYDSALVYHDKVIAGIFEQFRGGAHKTGNHSLLYLSDHGQCVGHDANRAGHSARTASGYRIPALVWRSVSDALAPQDKPFRSDWAGWTLVSLLGLDWGRQRSSRDILSPDYVWVPPLLPVPSRVDFEG